MLAVAAGLAVAACSGFVGSADPDPDSDSTEPLAPTAAPIETPTAPGGDSPDVTVEASGTPRPRAFDPDAYARNLNLILASTTRNTNHDASPFLDVASAELVPEELYGPRLDYLTRAGGNPEPAFPVVQGGQFRTGCEFSHFAYDDPLVRPGEPGAAHLHMFFGNTHVNAHSTYETLLDSGGSTCNGQELNRTGYWVPAMFDGQGNVRIPERVVVYYKGEGLSNGRSEVYPPEAAFVAERDLNTVGVDVGGAEGKFSFTCSDQWSGWAQPAANTIPDCDGDVFFDLYGVVDEPHVVLEMNVKFPQCWNGRDPWDWANSYDVPATGGWYGSGCEGEYNRNLPNLEYFVNYRVELGESTADWYLSSDVDPRTLLRSVPGGSSVHGDWWGAWHPDVNRQWVDNCVNFRADVASGCGFGYLTDGGPDGENPLAGPALRYRPQYTGPEKIPAATIYEQLCAPHTERAYQQPTDAAHCLVD